MAQKMLKFISVDKKMPSKREAEARVEDFDEIYQEFSQDLATEQAARCSQCGIPFCQVHCPLSNNIPDWLRMTAEGRLEEAYELSSATNNMPEICGRICPQDRLCEGNCVIEKGFDSVTIGTVEKYITETAWKEGWVKPPTPAAELGQSVGIIGGGPAGLAAAEEMRRAGYEVHVYDRYDRMGGLLIYGIPSFKLEKEVVERRTNLLAEGGVVYHTNFEVGKGATLADLRERHDAVLIATGVYNTRDVQLPGAGLNNTVQAIDYLTVSNKVGMGDTIAEFQSGDLDAKGKNIVVIGGGDTAMDCVRTAIRQGAKSVKCLYRRDRANMPGSLREVNNAEEEGVEFVWLTAPEAFIGDEDVTAVRAVKMRLGSPDASGRQTPKVIEGSAHNIKADLVIKALGFDPDDIPSLFDAPELGVSRWGTVQIDHRSMMTNIDGVFAAGDIVRGAALVVWAVRDGRDAAQRMDRYLTQKRSGMERQFQAAE
ncbi:MAG: NAD(P)-dependent oxidoreductase [Alphaproteobacteria bacterium]|jgi:glutamate synthase (NADPH) small chain|nr:NAD(P)-dependent oxidoreductase [Alphaproteobacteria bacterium]MBT5159054.1 NAD(P)-dependent oxidoreductase [Alphaproteobacteria bacterium]MBT5920000.1 NAD(P)-dependent oxidoreductase [Alphaproteobacteria bacterium]MBT6385012.1 NAD(P)-dependent oxidoreductase [Alphaproteobacteria bacterium]